MHPNLEPAAARRSMTLSLALFILLALTVTASAQPNGINFGTPISLPSTPPPAHDFNHDLLQLLSNESYPNLIKLIDGGNTIRVYINDGNTPGGKPGTFSNFVDTPSPVTLMNFLTGDFNNDGLLDVIGIDFNGNQVLTFLGAGNGKFQAPKFFGTGGFDPIFACAGDMKTHGKLDLAVVNHFDPSLSILIGDGAGNFSQGQVLPLPFAPQSILCGRMLPTSVHVDLATPPPPGLSNLLFFPGNGDGTFGPSQSFPMGPNPIGGSTELIGDTSLVQRFAFLNSNQSSNPLISGMTISPPAVQSTPITGPVSGFAIGDFSGFGGQQVITVGPNGVSAGNFGQGLVTNFGGVFNSPGFISSGNSIFVATGDVNGDAHLDIELTDPVTGKTTILPGTGFNPPTLRPDDVLRPSATANLPLTLQTGWYYDNALNGTGIFIEQGGKSGNGLFMGEFGYDASGNSLWYVSTGQMRGLNYSSTWLKVTGGQTLTGPYKAPTNSSIGNVTLSFTDNAHITMTRPGSTPVTFKRFTFTSSPTPLPPQAGAPQSGWWWAGASFSGTGYGIEIQANAVFIVAYVYDTNGNPVWYLATGAMSSPTSYSGTWQLYSGGPQLTSPESSYSGKVVTGSDVPMSLTFSDATHGTLTMGNVVIPIVRFQEF